MKKNMFNMTKKYLTIATLVSACAIGTTQASEEQHAADHNNQHAGGISYDFFDIAYMDVETHSDEGNGLLLRGAKSFGESFYVLGEMGSAGLEGHNGDFTFARAGVGFHTSFTNAIDGIAELTYESLEIEEDHHHFNEDGFGAAVGVRALFNQHLEGTARVRYVDFGHEDDVIASAELLFLFNHSFGLVAAYEKGNEEIISFGVRFQF